MQMKNIQVGVQGVMKRAELANSVDRRGPNPLEYTFYVLSSSNKLYEPKQHFYG